MRTAWPRLQPRLRDARLLLIDRRLPELAGQPSGLGQLPSTGGGSRVVKNGKRIEVGRRGIALLRVPSAVVGRGRSDLAVRPQSRSPHLGGCTDHGVVRQH